MIRIINKTWHTVTNASLNGSRGWRTLRCVRGASVTIGESQRRVDGVETQKMLTYEEQEAMRKAARDEVGTEPPCPFCGKPRVSRTSYIRCNLCGVNWSPAEGEDITKDPRLSRTKITAHTRPESSDTAKTARSSIEEQQ